MICIKSKHTAQRRPKNLHGNETDKTGVVWFGYNLILVVGGPYV